jgi:hypothetical protein
MKEFSKNLTIGVLCAVLVIALYKLLWMSLPFITLVVLIFTAVILLNKQINS